MPQEEDQATVTFNMHREVAKVRLSTVVFDICDRTDILIPILCIPSRDEVKISIIRMQVTTRRISDYVEFIVLDWSVRPRVMA